VRGSRIKNIVEALGGVERIDIVRWNDSLQVLIPNSLQPATIEEVFLYPRLERAVVLVKEDQLSLAIGRRGQNVRLASKLVEWEIEIMTHDELNSSIEKAESWFSAMPGATPEVVEALIEEGFLSFEDVAFLEPRELAEMGGVNEDDAEEMILYAEEEAERMEKEARAAKAGGAGERPARAPAPAEPPRSEARQAFDNLFIPAAAVPDSEPAGAAEEAGEYGELPAEEPLAEESAFETQPVAEETSEPAVQGEAPAVEAAVPVPEPAAATEHPAPVPGEHPPEQA
jgi:N utilization substance protein A